MAGVVRDCAPRVRRRTSKRMGPREARRREQQNDDRRWHGAEGCICMRARACMCACVCVCERGCVGSVIDLQQGVSLARALSYSRPTSMPRLPRARTRTRSDLPPFSLTLSLALSLSVGSVPPRVLAPRAASSRSLVPFSLLFLSSSLPSALAPSRFRDRPRAGVRPR